MVGEQAAQQEASFVNDGDVVAQLLNLLQAVAGEDDGAALGASLEQSVAQDFGVDGVEAGERLVEKH